MTSSSDESQQGVFVPQEASLGLTTWPLNEEALTVREVNQLPLSSLAWVGDAVYEIQVRLYLIRHHQIRTGKLHFMAIPYVSAPGQAAILRHLEETYPLAPEERAIIHRGVNFHTVSRAKHASQGEYRRATAFEILLGWLYCVGRQDRLEDIINEAISYIQGKLREEQS